ncbi:acyl-CoA dehydrogenase family protein [Kineosporia babensis]|uniref:Acyl-CoA dehydrogenase n=1 Tax=Kineosporia babensis TaxID=499548 RepID=A0A9X1NMX6_9ACTN|nr:hypothetical protein [Kineosporia babensis]MCD5316696.1 hypothetical protein [Kineosporia babensis]
MDRCLTGITVPKAFGGPGCSVTTLVEALHRVAQVEPDRARLLHGHYLFLQVLAEQATLEQQSYFFGEALAGACFAGVGPGFGGPDRGAGPQITLARWRNGVYRLDGESVCAPGVLRNDWLVVPAVLVDELAEPSDEPDEVFAVIRRDDLGVTHDGAVGSLWLDGVRVAPGCIVPYSTLFDRPTTYPERRKVTAQALNGRPLEELLGPAQALDVAEQNRTPLAEASTGM